MERFFGDNYKEIKCDRNNEDLIKVKEYFRMNTLLIKQKFFNIYYCSKIIDF